ncbi:sulfurtransferase [Pedobacter sp.]|uniref:sulfurtransferase n=1 Tax=Pedobacter sp. TaxID=1411316 RepID=UPI0031D10D89
MANQNAPSPIIKVDELKLLTEKSHDLVIVDVSNEKNAKENYLQRHLDNAIFLDLNTDLADIKTDLALGGRHPLPQIANFLDVLSRIGISPDTHIIIYDHKNGANAAARFWWMMKAIGHKNVQVLDGGFQEAEKRNYPINGHVPVPKKVGNYPSITHWQLPTNNLEEVDLASRSKSHLIIDVREKPRYDGEFEPIDLIAGHIPNAINIPFVDNLEEGGLFKAPKKLKAKYQEVFKEFDNGKIIVHCGSGVTACHSLLAMSYAGFGIPKLYPGSWSEWSRNNKPIEKL